MEKKFVKTTFAILSFMMLLPTSVFAEDAGIWKLLLWESLFWKQISQLLIVMQTVHCLFEEEKQSYR